MVWLKEKIDAGAEFIFTQMFYDAEIFLDWVRRVRKAGIKVPIVPGTFDSFFVVPLKTRERTRKLRNESTRRVPRPSSLFSSLTLFVSSLFVLSSESHRNHAHPILRNLHQMGRSREHLGPSTLLRRSSPRQGRRRSSSRGRNQARWRDV